MSPGGPAGPAPGRAPDRDLLVDDVPVARYVVDPRLDIRHGPRPYLHPVRTLRGAVVTDALPADHVWHLGASLAVPDVSGANLWGGRTYVRDTGYTWLDDHGRIGHVRWLDTAPDRLEHLLHWCDPDGVVLLTERRRLTAGPLRDTAGAVDPTGWLLDVQYLLTAPEDRDVTLGSPATNGRPDGSGYGGFFWRARTAQPPRVFTAGADGEESVNGSAGPWVALTGADPAGARYGLLFHGLSEGDRWFVRSRSYPGVCAAFAFDHPRTLPAGSSRRGRHRIAVLDGPLTRSRAFGVAPAFD